MAAKGKTAIVVVVLAAVLFIGGGVALAATKPRAQLLPPPPPPGLGDDLRLIGSELVRYGGKAVAAAAKAIAKTGGKLLSKRWNKETAIVAATGVGAPILLYKVGRGLLSTNDVTPEVAAASNAMAVQREQIRRTAPLTSIVGPRTAGGLAVGTVRGLG